MSINETQYHASGGGNVNRGMTVVQSSSLGITSLASTADSSTQNNAIGHHHYLSAYQQSTSFTYQDQQQLSDHQHQLNGST